MFLLAVLIAHAESAAVAQRAKPDGAARSTSAGPEPEARVRLTPDLLVGRPAS